MNQYAAVLHNNPLFRELSLADIQQYLLPHVRILDFPKGSHLLRAQEVCDCFGILLQGKVNILHIYTDGNYSLSGVLEPGDLFGADLICTKSRTSPYHAEATQPTQLLALPADLLSAHLLPEPLHQKLSTRLMQYIANENIRKEYRLAILLQKGLRDRIMTYLTMQAGKRRSATFTIPFTRDELASYLCVNRSCLSHELSLMAQEGLLTFQRNTFTLLNWDAKNGDY